MDPRRLADELSKKKANEALERLEENERLFGARRAKRWSAAGWWTARKSCGC